MPRTNILRRDNSFLYVITGYCASDASVLVVFSPFPLDTIIIIIIIKLEAAVSSRWAHSYPMSRQILMFHQILYVPIL